MIQKGHLGYKFFRQGFRDVTEFGILVSAKWTDKVIMAEG